MGSLPSISVVSALLIPRIPDSNDDLALSTVEILIRCGSLSPCEWCRLDKCRKRVVCATNVDESVDSEFGRITSSVQSEMVASVSVESLTPPSRPIRTGAVYTDLIGPSLSSHSDEYTPSIQHVTSGND